jgi:hypothetical protein
MTGNSNELTIENSVVVLIDHQPAVDFSVHSVDRELYNEEGPFQLAPDYLEIKQGMLRGRADTSSGGRSLNDDAVDTTLTFNVAAGSRPRITDGIDQATARASDDFPNLAPPNPDAAAIGGFLVPSTVADQLAALEAAGPVS